MKVVLLPASLVLSLLVSGIIFGFQALRPILIEHGAYSDNCISTGCDDQLLKLSWIFSLCSTLTNICALVIGLLLDGFGPKLTIGLGSIVFSLGCLATSFAWAFQSLYLIGFLMISVSGPTVFMGLLSQTRIFTSNQGLVMAAFVGTFDASTIVFYVFQLLLKNKLVDNLFIIFRYYGILPLILSAIVLMNWESEQYKVLQKDGEDLIDQDENIQLISSKIHSKEDSDFWFQVKSGYFIGITLILSVYMTRLNFYISTINDQLEDLGSKSQYFKESIPSLVAFFNISLPIGGIVSIPIIGFFLDYMSFPTLFSLLSLVGTVFSVLNFLPIVQLQLIAICMFVMLRPFVYSLSGDFCSRMFRPQTFGRIYGLMNFLSGIVNMSQYLLSLIAIEHMKGSYGTSNMILLSLAIVTFAFPVYLRTLSKSAINQVL